MIDWERVKEIEGRAEKAKPGPWTWELNGFSDDPKELQVDHGWSHQGPDLVSAGDAQVIVAASWGHDADGLSIDRADAEFIAHAREDVPWLCERLRELARALSRSVPHPDDVALVASLPDEFLSPSEEKAGGSPG